MLDHLVASFETSAELALALPQRIAHATYETLRSIMKKIDNRRINVPPMSEEWLRQHESNRRNDRYLS